MSDAILIFLVTSLLAFLLAVVRILYRCHAQRIDCGCLVIEMGNKTSLSPYRSETNSDNISNKEDNENSPEQKT